MQSDVRKSIQGAIEGAILRTFKDSAIKFRSQRGLRHRWTLTDVELLVKEGLNKIDTLDLAREYEPVNRTILLEDFRNKVGKEIVQMLDACM